MNTIEGHPKIYCEKKMCGNSKWLLYLLHVFFVTITERVILNLENINLFLVLFCLINNNSYKSWPVASKRTLCSSPFLNWILCFLSDRCLKSFMHRCSHSPPGRFDFENYFTSFWSSGKLLQFARIFCGAEI